MVISERVQRWAEDPLNGCKTLDYSAMVLARLEASQAGAGDVLLRSSQGGLCCGSSANLLVQQGGRWLTPPLSGGARPGVMRARGLANGADPRGAPEPSRWRRSNQRCCSTRPGLPPCESQRLSRWQSRCLNNS